MTNKFIKDPIFKEIDLNRDPIIGELISCKEFQRLQDIMQLGICYKLFPTAMHSRYIHSLGVYEVASRFLDVIGNKCSKKNKRLVQVAALLHDLGHGPFSHVFERFGGSHEKWTLDIIVSKKSSINKVLKKYSVDINELILIYENKHPIKWLNQIISSDLDVDRIDYLLRDSYFIGTHYGTIDLDILLRRFDIINETLVFSIKSFNMIESFLLGRIYMNIDIYENKNLMVFEWTLELIFKRLAELKNEWDLYEKNISISKKYDWIYKKKEVSLDLYIELDDSSLITFINELANVTNDELLKLIIKGFKNGENFTYIKPEDFNKNIKIINKDISKDYIYSEKTIKHKLIFSKEVDKHIVFYDSKNNLIEFKKTKLFDNLDKQVNISKIVLLNNNFID
ncbi:MAG: HD domain-containing protein [Mycoplasmoidaceae bacterium]